MVCLSTEKESHFDRGCAVCFLRGKGTEVAPQDGSSSYLGRLEGRAGGCSVSIAQMMGILEKMVLRF